MMPPFTLGSLARELAQAAWRDLRRTWVGDVMWRVEDCRCVRFVRDVMSFGAVRWWPPTR